VTVFVNERASQLTSGGNNEENERDCKNAKQVTGLPHGFFFLGSQENDSPA